MRCGGNPWQPSGSLQPTLRVVMGIVRVPLQRDASRSNGMPPYGMGPHAKALERDAPNGRGDPAGRPYEAAMVLTVRNGKVAINSWNGTIRSVPAATIGVARPKDSHRPRLPDHPA